MVSLHSIFKDIAILINDTTDKDLLISRIENNQFDWEKIVQVASKHLVIPLIYYKLKSKKLLNILDDELHFYLEEIANQNFNRNKKILEEVNEIGSLLNKHEIDHVFVKGAAHLVSGLYENIGERMIGDIDILVNKKDIFRTQNLIIKHGYSQAKKSLTDIYTDQKHLPRLLPKNRLAAIEVHSRVLRTISLDMLDSDEIINSKSNYSKIAIPNDHNMFMISALNFEINDRGYYYNFLGLRNAYDYISLLNKIPESELNNLIQNKYVISLLNKSEFYFKQDLFSKLKSGINFRKTLFLFSQKNGLFRKIQFNLLNYFDLLNLILKRFSLLISNPAYRRDSFNKRKEIVNFIKSRV